MRLAVPHPVFTLKLNKRSPAHALDSVRMTGWRHLLLDDDTPLAFAEWSVGTRGARLRVARIASGIEVAAFVDAIGRAERSSMVKRGEFALGALNIPSLHAHALWLRNLQGDQDLYMPLDIGFMRGRKHRIRRSAEFLELLQGVRKRIPVEISRRHSMS